ncbi:four-carbon acid sugar kinase family protein [Streptococcus cameli]
MIKLVVLADDFTGALDTGVQFSKFGAKTHVTTNLNVNSSFLDSDCDVLVIDTESRYLSFEDSHHLLFTLGQQVKELKIPYLYKKVDSALRGNISSEIKAIQEVYQEEGLAIIPAFPAINRTVKNGVLYIEDKPVAESVFGQDPYEPVLESNLMIRLKNEANLSVQLANPESLLEAGQAYLFDASTDQELNLIGENLQHANLLSVTVGCAGFAKVLAKFLFGEQAESHLRLEHPLTVICGSVNPITQEQVAHAKEIGVAVFNLDGKQLLEKDYWQSSAGQKDIEQFLESFAETDCTVFESFSPETLASITSYLEKSGMEKEEVRFRIGTSFGNLFQSFLEKNVHRTFLFTGGDTLYQSMQVIGISDLFPVGEVSPGVVLSHFNWEGNTIYVLTKSGGFGHPSLIEDIMHLIKKESPC